MLHCVYSLRQKCVSMSDARTSLLLACYHQYSACETCSGQLSGTMHTEKEELPGWRQAHTRASADTDKMLMDVPSIVCGRVNWYSAARKRGRPASRCSSSIGTAGALLWCRTSSTSTPESIAAQDGLPGAERAGMQSQRARPFAPLCPLAVEKHLRWLVTSRHTSEQVATPARLELT